MHPYYSWKAFQKISRVQHEEPWFGRSPHGKTKQNKTKQNKTNYLA